MENYYFTFGQSHVDKEGNPLKDFFVRVSAESYQMARCIFLEWAKHNLPSANKWSMQYNENNFNKSYYSNGELTFLSQKYFR